MNYKGVTINRVVIDLTTARPSISVNTKQGGKMLDIVENMPTPQTLQLLTKIIKALVDKDVSNKK